MSAERERPDWADDCEYPEYDVAHEPVGSCEECGINLYEDDDYLCDQCLWREMLAHGEAEP